MPDFNLSGNPLIKLPNSKGVNTELPDSKDKDLLKKTAALSRALADGKITDAELVKLAEINFTVDDFRNILNNSKGIIANLNLSDDDKQRLTDDLMTRIETYRQLNQEREGQEPTQFGL